MTTPEPLSTDLLVVGAGPFGCSTAALARDRGIDTHILGRPMQLWREQMPADMYLRSNPDWHLDGSEELTFRAFLKDRGIREEDVDPVPIEVFLDMTEWFIAGKGLDVDERYAVSVRARNDDRGFEALLVDGTVVHAERVVAAPGIASYAHLPDWAEKVPAARRSHTSELVDFDDLADRRVLVVGGRQSAYEWAALLCDHRAARVDVVHRQDVPHFEKVSWTFADPYVDLTRRQSGWWRSLPPAERDAIAQRFWQVGRLTLEPWLVPRLRPDVVHRHPRREVAAVSASEDLVTATLDDDTTLEVDHVLFASGYQADLSRVPYLTDLVARVSVPDGFPDLSPGLETSLPGLYLTGFSATRDFGPFFGFTLGCTTAATLVVDDLLR